MLSTGFLEDSALNIEGATCQSLALTQPDPRYGNCGRTVRLQHGACPELHSVRLRKASRRPRKLMGYLGQGEDLRSTGRRGDPHPCSNYQRATQAACDHLKLRGHIQQSSSRQNFRLNYSGLFRPHGCRGFSMLTWLSRVPPLHAGAHFGKF
jgi:hypothetical protein